MKIAADHLCVARVTHEDDDFLTLEVAKHDDVKWHVAPLPGEDKPTSFFTVMFVHKSDDGKSMEIWKPWESE